VSDNGAAGGGGRHTAVRARGCQTRGGTRTLVSAWAAVSGTRRYAHAGVRHTAARWCQAHGGTRTLVSGTRRYAHAGIRQWGGGGRRCQAHGGTRTLVSDNGAVVGGSVRHAAVRARWC
jgi:hypothetical protein